MEISSTHIISTHILRTSMEADKRPISILKMQVLPLTKSTVTGSGLFGRLGVAPTTFGRVPDLATPCISSPFAPLVTSK